MFRGDDNGAMNDYTFRLHWSRAGDGDSGFLQTFGSAREVSKDVIRFAPLVQLKEAISDVETAARLV